MEYRIEYCDAILGLKQASVTDGTTSISIPLFFEPELAETIEARMKTVNLKENATLDLFRMVVAGCIRTSMRPS